MAFLRRWWRRVVLSLLMSAAIGAGTGLIYLYWDRQNARKELEDAVALVDHSEPGWRLEEIERRRPVVADDQNGARVVVAAFQLIPKDWDSTLFDELVKIAPQMRLQADLAARLEAVLRTASAAVSEGRKADQFASGRFDIRYTPEFAKTNFEDLTKARVVTNLLLMDAHHAIESGLFARAISSTHAMFNMGRCLEGEPSHIPQLVRVAIQAFAESCLERTLGNGEVADEDLFRMQHLLARESASELFCTGLNGERAGSHNTLTNLANRDLPVTVIDADKNRAGHDISLWDYVIDPYMRTLAYRINALVLKQNTKLLTVCQFQGHDRYRALREIDGESQKIFDAKRVDTVMARNATSIHRIIAQAEQRVDTQLHCAIAAVAAERFRLNNARWPKSLEELVETKLLASVPEDLYDGRPLRLRRAPDGIVVHSCGKEGNYQGDTLDRADEIDVSQPRVEFRLWDVVRRRQPPPMARKAIEAD